MASDRMKTRYDKLANSAGYHEGDRVWLFLPNRTKGKSPKLHPAWEGPYKIITRINDVVYRIQKTPRSRMMVVHLDRLAPYQGVTRVKPPQGGAVVAVKRKEGKTRATGRMLRPVTDVASSALGRQER
jgi:hypothetical protein